MKKKRKQIIKGIFFILVLLFLAIQNKSVKASEQENSSAVSEKIQIAIEEADITLQLPDNCYWMDQNLTADNPYLQKVGGDWEKIQSYYKEAGIVLNAVAMDDSYEIVVTMNENNNVDYIYNMQSLTENQIREFADTIQKTYQSYGYTVEGYQLYETEQAVYVLFHFEQLYEEQKVQCSQYYTIRDSRIYNITLRSYVGETTASMEKMIDEVVDSISFSEREKSTYENEENGVSFQLADGWTRVAKTQDNPYIQAQYVHVNKLGESIQFFCMDLWGNMDSLHQLTNTREDLTIKEGMTEADKKKYKVYVSGFFDDYSSVFFQKIGERWYLVSEQPMQVESDNIEGTYLQKSVVTIQNGILYAFQYGYYEKGNLHEAAFEKLLLSVSYQSPKLLMEDGQHYRNIAGMLYKATILVAIIILMFVGVIYLYYKGIEEKKLCE